MAEAPKAQGPCSRSSARSKEDRQLRGRPPHRAGLRDDVGPEIDRRALVPQTHRKRLATPVLDRPLAPLGSIRVSLVTLVFAVGGELRLVDRELPLGETKSGLVGRQVGEEELEEPRIAKLRRRIGWSIEPEAERGHPRGRDREDPSSSAVGLARLGDQAEGCQPRRFASIQIFMSELEPVTGLQIGRASCRERVLPTV